MKKSFFLAMCFVAWISAVHAAGSITPSQPIVLVEESKRVSSTIITNTGEEPLLLVTEIYELPDDRGIDVTASPKLIRIEPGAKQVVRFVLSSSEKLKTQHLMRVRFEGIPLKKEGANSKINLAHDMPLLVHPQAMKLDPAPWKSLTVKKEDNDFVISNESANVVRFNPSARLEPSGKFFPLQTSYVLPGKSIRIAAAGNKSIVIFPAGVYGEIAPDLELTPGN